MVVAIDEKIHQFAQNIGERLGFAPGELRPNLKVCFTMAPAVPLDEFNLAALLRMLQACHGLAWIEAVKVEGE